MTSTPKEEKADTAAGDAVLRKMLNTPPQPHKASRAAPKDRPTRSVKETKKASEKPRKA